MAGTEEKFEELRLVAHERESLYKVLSALFLARPSDELMREVLKREFLDGLEEAFGDEAATAFRRVPCNLNGHPQELEQEFSALFLAPTGQYVAPYECAYREKRITDEGELPGLLMGRAAEQVLALYAESGAASNSDELPDHIAVELAFMELLLRRESDCWDNELPAEAVAWLTRERQFLENHLAQWVPELCEAILTKTRCDFYIGVALLTRSFIAAETDMLRDIPSPGAIETWAPESIAR